MNDVIHYTRIFLVVIDVEKNKAIEVVIKLVTGIVRFVGDEIRKVTMNNNTELLPIKPNNPFSLGRHLHHDLRNANYRALVSPPPRSLVGYKSWMTMTIFDQGQTSRCTTEASIGMLRTTPYITKFTERTKFDEPQERQAAYERWQSYDPPEWGVHDGSASDSPFKGMRAEGIITGWRWLFGEAEVREFVTWYGPVCVGTIWNDNMFYPDDKGYLNIGGSFAGGHEYRILQYSRIRQAYRIMNSWGNTWGQHGRAWLRAEDLNFLLEQNGDAVTISI